MLAMEEMQVTSADCGSGDLEDHVGRLKDLGLRYIQDLHLLFSHPAKSLHHLTPITRILVVRHILLRDGAVIMTNDFLGSIGRLGG